MIFEAIKDIWSAFKEFTDQALLFATIAVFLYGAVIIGNYFYRAVKNKPQRSIGGMLFKLALAAAFGIYCSYAISLTLSGREAGSRSELINLHLFGTFAEGGGVNLHAIENWLLFIPFGLMVPMIWKYNRSLVRTTLLGFVSSVLIETTQIMTGRGFFEIDDVVLNTLGTVCGYLIFSCLYDGFLGVKRRLLTDVAAAYNNEPPLGNLYDRFALRNGVYLFALQSIPIIGTMCMIMGFSGETGTQSSALSSAIARVVLRICAKIFGGKAGITPDAGVSAVELVEKIIRKMAHMFEYGMLAFFVWALVYSIRKLLPIISYAVALLSVVALGMLDEHNQAGIIGRDGTFRDVLFDLSGAVIAMIIVATLISIATRKYEKQSNVTGKRRKRRKRNPQ